MTRKILGLLTLLAATTQLTAQPITVISGDEQRFDFRSEFLPEQFAKYFPQMNKHNANELRLENVSSELMPTLLELFRRHKLTLNNSSEDLPEALTPILSKVTDIEQAFELLGLVDGFNLRDEFLYAVAFRIAELAGDAALDFPEDSSLRSKLRRILKYCQAIVQNNDIFRLPDMLIRPIDIFAFKAFEYGSKKYPLAQYRLGSCHAAADIFETANKEEAVRLWKLAAKQGHVDSLNNLAVYHFHGIGIDPKIPRHKRLKEAVRLLTLSVERGSMKVAYRLSTCYFENLGIPASMSEAERIEKGMYYLTLAAEQGDTQALYDLAIKYKRSEFVQENPEKAIRLLTRAADLGHADSQCLLGWSYAVNTFGIPQNLTREEREDMAIQFLRKAVQQGHADALDFFLRINELFAAAQPQQ